MDIIGIETVMYEKTIKEIENFVDSIHTLIQDTSRKQKSEWLDSQEV